jgi:uncharacterized membrane protein YeaQ/YmgE (transglycosylase-associated protein family)
MKSWIIFILIGIMTALLFEWCFRPEYPLRAPASVLAGVLGALLGGAVGVLLEGRLGIAWLGFLLALTGATVALSADEYWCVDRLHHPVRSHSRLPSPPRRSEVVRRRKQNERKSIRLVRDPRV